MAALTGERWRTLAPYLDQALDLADEERVRWLASLRDRDPALAADLACLLAERQSLAAERFLEDELERPAVQADVTANLSHRMLGGFLLRELVGSGGFADVYLAEQVALSREAVVKVLRPGPMGEEDVKRFLGEVQLASRFDHPYVAHIYAFGSELDGVCWIAMERVRGSTLRQVLTAVGPLTLDRFLPLLERLAEVVHSAHEQGIVHRDLKPENIMVISRAGRLLPKLLDFGISRELTLRFPGSASPLVGVRLGQDDARDQETGPGAIVGTPGYMAPELWTNPTSAGPAADQYALGAVAYEALTGRLAFSGSTLSELAGAHRAGALAPLGAGFPEALDGVLRRAVASDPVARHASVLAFATAFRRAAEGQASSVATRPHSDAIRPPGPPESFPLGRGGARSPRRIDPPHSRHRRGLWIGCGVAAGSVLAGILFAIGTPLEKDAGHAEPARGDTSSPGASPGFLIAPPTAIPSATLPPFASGAQQSGRPAADPTGPNLRPQDPATDPRERSAAAATAPPIASPPSGSRAPGPRATEEPNTQPTGSSPNARLQHLVFHGFQDLYRELNAGFAARWRKETGGTVTIVVTTSPPIAGEPHVPRTLLRGAEPDVLTWPLAHDLDGLSRETTALDRDWRKRFAYDASPFFSTVVFVVRKGNPKGVKDWDDLIVPGVHVVAADPTSISLEARWSYLAAWTWALKKFDGNESDVRGYMSQLYGRLLAMALGSGGDGDFTYRRIGDVLLSSESEARALLRRFHREGLEIVRPSVSLSLDMSVAVLDTFAAKHGTEAVARAYLQYLYSDDAQRIINLMGFRPRIDGFAAGQVGGPPDIQLHTVDQIFGGWGRARESHFDRRSFDQLYRTAR